MVHFMLLEQYSHQVLIISLIICGIMIIMVITDFILRVVILHILDVPAVLLLLLLSLAPIGSWG